MEVCAYEGCRHEIKPGGVYCKYHARLIEIENNSPQWLNDMIKKMKDEMKSGAVNIAKAQGGYPVKIKSD